MHCWGGGAAETASSEKADNGHVTKVNHFCNGLGSNSQEPGGGPYADQVRFVWHKRVSDSEKQWRSRRLINKGTLVGAPLGLPGYVAVVFSCDGLP